MGILQMVMSAVAAALGYNLKRSTRFNDDDSSYLNWTPTSTGSRATWSLSFWIKRGNLGSTQYLFAAKDSSNYFELLLNSSDQLAIYNYQSSGAALCTTDRVFRDCSAFYHIVYTYDTTQSGTDKLKLFVNGTQETSFGTDNRSSTGTSYWNKDVAHTIGSSSTPNNHFDGLISDVNFVDGTALDATSFGETNILTGQWIPKEYTHSTSDFHTVNDGTVWSSNNTGGTNSGLGWDKGFNGAGPSGGDGYVETSSAGTTLTLNKAFTTLEFAGNGSGFEFNGTGVSHGGAYTWTDITSSISSPLTTIKITNASVLSAVRVDGQILTDSAGDNSFHLAMDPAETGTNYSDSLTSSSGTWHNASFEPYQAFDGSPTAGNYCQTNAGTSMTFAPSSLSWSSSLEVMTAAVSTTAAIDGGSSVALTADEWTTVASGAGSISTSLIITHGTAASLKGIRVDGKVLVDYTAIGHDSSGQNNDWHENNLVVDVGSTVYSSNVTNSHSNAWAGGQGPEKAFNGVAAASVNMANANGVGGTITWTFSGLSGSCRVWIGNAGGTVTDGNGTVRGNNVGSGESWVTCSGDISAYNGSIVISVSSDAPSLGAVEVDGVILTDPQHLDLLADTPGAPYDNGLNGGANYATLNPLNTGANLALSNGNLRATESGGSYSSSMSTMGVSSGKWYCEMTLINDKFGFGVGTGDTNMSTWLGQTSTDWVWRKDGAGPAGRHSGSDITYNHSTSPGDVIGLMLDLSGSQGILKYSVNGSDKGAMVSNIPIGPTYFITCGDDTSTGAADFHLNFGQRAFDNLPTGYKALNAFSLPEPTIVDPSTVFDTKLYTGNGGTQSITGMDFEPDFVWIKNRSSAGNWHTLNDVVRGTGKDLYSNSTAVEFTANANTGLVSYNADGFTVGDVTDGGNGVNGSPGGTHCGAAEFVSWSWDAGSSNTSVSVGDLNSSVYDQSEVWSDDGANAVSGNPWTNGFDLTDANTVYADHNQTATWTPSGTITGITKLEMKGYAYNAGGTYSKIKINGTDYTSTFDTDYTAWREITGISTLTSISVGQEDGTHATGFTAVRINGKELIDTGVSVTNVPTIPSTYRANPSAGFSIVSYTGNSTNGATIAHGLNAKTDFFIVKNRESTESWCVYHKDEGATKYLLLQVTNGSSSSTALWNDTEPTSSVISLGDYDGTNNGDDFIAYCWSEVEGYSKFGSWTSTGDSFVYLGFKPAFLMAKCTSQAGEWMMYDLLRMVQGSDSNILMANSSAAEDDGSPNNYTGSQALVDLLSNGFKIRHSGSAPLGDSGRTFIYCAFAENPLKYANAR